MKKLIFIFCSKFSKDGKEGWMEATQQLEEERLAVGTASISSRTRFPGIKELGYQAQNILMRPCPQSLHGGSREIPSETSCGVGPGRQQRVSVTKPSANGR